MAILSQHINQSRLRRLPPFAQVPETEKTTSSSDRFPLKSTGDNKTYCGWKKSAPPKKPWNDDSLVSTNKQCLPWFQGGVGFRPSTVFLTKWTSQCFLSNRGAWSRAPRALGRPRRRARTSGAAPSPPRWPDPPAPPGPKGFASGPFWLKPRLPFG